MQAPEFSLSVAPERCPGLEGRVWHSAAPAAAAVLDNTRISFRQAAGAGPGLELLEVLAPALAILLLSFTLVLLVMSQTL